MSEKDIIFEGNIAVSAIIKGKVRKIKSVLISGEKNNRDRKIVYLLNLCKKEKIKVKFVSPQEIDALANGKSHGGIIAIANQRKYSDLNRICDITKSITEPVVVMLDGIEDPFNFGYAVRALYAFGIDAIITRERDWSFAEGVIVKSSAGTSELMPIAQVSSAEFAADFFRKKDFKIACTAKKNATSLFETNLTGKVFLFIGGERRGITRSFLEKADLLIEIPYAREFRASLTATNSTAVFGAEIFKQRQYK